jgi:acyl transferase domain-containing protein
MKAVLALEKGVIPPTIGVVNPNPSIDMEGARVDVVTEAKQWPDKANKYRRVSVNSFGYGYVLLKVFVTYLLTIYVRSEQRC